MLWPQEYCRFFATTQEASKPLRFLWGGHNLQTRFSHFKVQVNDLIYPLCVKNKTLYVLARMKVKALMTCWDYVSLHPEDSYLISHSCANEVLVGEAGTTIRFDVAVPQNVLESWRFQSQKRQRGLKFLESGKLKHSISLQGVYRLSEPTAQKLANLLNADRKPGLDAATLGGKQLQPRPWDAILGGRGEKN
jgi:hypothetical protein